MDMLKRRDEIEEVIPGVVQAYQSLKTKNGMGIYTSNGAFYNNTFFGRDAGMSAKFVADYDHQVARDTIVALVALQGTKTDDITQEGEGRIHHEYRDMRTWQHRGFERLLLGWFAKRWGAKNKELLTYYAIDTTALFIRLVNKYVTHTDQSILEKQVKNARDETTNIGDSVARAANWILTQVDASDHVVSHRTNDWALPYQTFQDSSTAFPRTDGSLANFRRGISYTEAQAFSIDALEDAARLLPNNERKHEWISTAQALRVALMRDFWIEDQNYFGSAIDVDGIVDMPTVTAGWTLNTGLWDELPKSERQKKLTAIVTRLFSDDFLTPVGLRSRSLNSPQPLPGVIEYHGRLTVWPMFTFMVIEGLRHHRMHRLALQLENRLINGINANGAFEEFLIIDGGGHMLKSTNRWRARARVDGQMLPEKTIAFTVVPAMALAQRVIGGQSWPKPATWIAELEDSILATIDDVSRATPDRAADSLPAVVPTKLRRVRGNLRSMWYFNQQRRRM